MELIASLFCHVPETLSESEAQQELQRQYDAMAQYAADTGRVVEHCFFHVGEFNFENPDEVLLRFSNAHRKMILDLFLQRAKKCFPCHSKHTFHVWRCALCERECKKSLDIKMSKWWKKNFNRRMYTCTGAYS